MARKKKSGKKTKAKAKRKAGRLRTRARVKAKPRAKARANPKAKTGKAAPNKPAAAKAPPPVTELPAIEVATTSGQRLRLSDLKGKNVVLYFYPKDDTPGCTAEGCDIRDRFDDFERRDTVVLGVSRDDLVSHERFKEKFGFPFELVSDPDEKLCRAFGVIQEKSLYGKSYMGIDRSTFVFDKSGKLRKEFRGVKVAGHANELLSVLEKL